MTLLRDGQQQRQGAIVVTRLKFWQAGKGRDRFRLAYNGSSDGTIEIGDRSSFSCDLRLTSGNGSEAGVSWSVLMAIAAWRDFLPLRESIDQRFDQDSGDTTADAQQQAAIAASGARSLLQRRQTWARHGILASDLASGRRGAIASFREGI